MAKFIKSATSSEHWINDSVPEFCLAGRSNVGKSSLINALANAKIAITSSTPGRTKLINFFDFNEFRLVDLPGFGYAKASKKDLNDIETIIGNFLINRTNLFGVILVLDARYQTKVDHQLYQMILQRFSNVIIVVNKCDQLSNNELNNALQSISKLLKVSKDQLTAVSTKKKTNLNKLFSILKTYLIKIK